MVEHKKLGSDYDRQQEKLKEVWTELKDKMEALRDQGKMMVDMTTKVMEEAAKERMEVTSQNYPEMERSKVVFDRVQTTYQTKLRVYEVAITAIVDLIKTKLGINRIQMIVAAWRGRTKTKIDDCSATMWNQWS